MILPGCPAVGSSLTLSRRSFLWAALALVSVLASGRSSCAAVSAAVLPVPVLLALVSRPGGAAVSRFVVVAAGAGGLNCDGAIGSGDVDAFVLALIGGEAAYNLAYPNCNYLAADMNADALVNFADINAFVALLTQ